MMHMGGYLEYHGDIQLCGNIIMHLGDILSTVEVFSTVGDTMLCHLSTPID